MGGGRWNHEQFKVYELGEKLSNESDVALVSVGRQLRLMSAWIDEADRCYSGDGSSWNERTRGEALMAMAPVALEVIQERAQDLMDDLQQIKKLIDALAGAK